MVAYRHHCKQNSIASKHQMSLLSFVTDVSLNLRHSSKPVLFGRRKRSYLPPPTPSPPPKVGKETTLPKPVPHVRYDLIDHFPQFTEKRGRCLFCPMGYSYVIYNKCYVYASNKIASTIFITKEKSF